MFMRTLFLLLLLANAAFYAYAFVARERNTAETAGPELQINAEKIRIVKRAATAAGAGVKTVPAAPAPAACLEWGVMAGPDVARADAALASLALSEARIQRTIADAGGYWVHIPPLKTAPAVEKRLRELKALGVGDFYVVQDSSQWRNAISLGIFKTDEAAASFLDALKAKGVRSAVSERRENFLKQVTYFVREPGEDIVARLAELQREFPGSQIRAAPCPAPPETAKG